MATWPVASPNTHPDRSPARGQGRTRLGEGVDDQRLPGPGRADQGLDPGAEGEQAADRGGLVFPSLIPTSTRSSRNRCASLGGTAAASRAVVAARRALPVCTCSGVAGPDPAPVWLDCARDFPEYWVHQQQIRAATGRTGNDDPKVVHAVLDTFLRTEPA